MAFLKEENVLHAIKQELKIEIVTLENLLDELKFQTRFGLLDVDVEGFDLEVLKGNNWNKYRPKIVLVESNELFENEPKSVTSLFLKEVGYGICAKLVQQPFECGNTIYYDLQ